MSSDLYYVSTNGRHRQIGRRFNGRIRLVLDDLDRDEREDILRMLAEIARDPSAHLHAWGDPVDDAQAALQLLDLLLAGVDLARLAADVEALRARVAGAGGGAVTPTLLVNYSASRVVCEPHSRRRVEERCGSVTVPAGLPLMAPAVRAAIRAAMDRDFPGYRLSGYCYADPNVCHLTGRPCPSREACSEAQSGCGGVS